MVVLDLMTKAPGTLVESADAVASGGEEIVKKSVGEPRIKCKDLKN